MCKILHCFTWVCTETGEKTGAESQLIFTVEERWHFPPNNYG